MLCLLVVACESRSAPTPAIAPEPTKVDEPLARIDATDLLVKFECARCHDVPHIEPAGETKHCVKCHQAIQTGTFAAKKVHLDRWRKRITSLRWAPSLANTDRFRRVWVQAFLLAPHDVRPGLVGEMPRLAMTVEEAGRIAAHLVPDDPAPDVVPDEASAHRVLDDELGYLRVKDDPTIEGCGGSFARSEHRSAGVLPSTSREIAAGEQLYRALACARCHRFTGNGVDDAELHAKGRTQVTDGSWELAPDLRFARKRMTDISIARWIESPRGAMPKLGVNAESASLLARFIASSEITDATPRTVPARLPVLERAVTYDEVDKRVFKNVCWHCHAVPDFARGDGGPGNSGGFGFAPRGLDLSSYEGVASGSLDERGERRSIFAKLPDGTPRLVAHLMARYTEEAGGSIDGVRGMPLGLPPLSLEEIQLVESWIAQGRPR